MSRKEMCLKHRLLQQFRQSKKPHELFLTVIQYHLKAAKCIGLGRVMPCAAQFMSQPIIRPVSRWKPSPVFAQVYSVHLIWSNQLRKTQRDNIRIHRYRILKSSRNSKVSEGRRKDFSHTRHHFFILIAGAHCKSHRIVGKRNTHILCITNEYPSFFTRLDECM